MSENLTPLLSNPDHKSSDQPLHPLIELNPLNKELHSHLDGDVSKQLPTALPYSLDINDVLKEDIDPHIKTILDDASDPSHLLNLNQETPLALDPSNQLSLMQMDYEYSTNEYGYIGGGSDGGSSFSPGDSFGGGGKRSARAQADMDNRLFAGSKYGHDTIVYLDSLIIGYQLTDEHDGELINAQLREMGVHGKSLDQVIDNFAHSELMRQRIILLATNMSGVDISNPVYNGWVADQQNQASQRPMSVFLKEFAHSDFIHQVIVDMFNNMGTTYNDGDITWTQDRLAEGKSAQWVRNEHAHGYHGRQVAVDMFNNMGMTYNDGDIGWTQDRLAEGKSAQWVRNEHAHSESMRLQIINVASNMSGVDIGNPVYNGWVVGQQDYMGDNHSISDFKTVFAHGDFMRQQIINVATNMSGVDISDPVYNNWVASQQDYMGQNHSISDFRIDFAHGQFVLDEVVKMGTEVTGNDMSTPEQTVWRQNIQDALGNGMTFTEARHNVAFYDPTLSGKITNYAQQQGITLTPEQINTQKSLIEKQGFTKTQGSFNKVMNAYNNIAGQDNIDIDRIPYYQQLGNNKQVNRAIYEDIANTKGSDTKVNFVDDDGHIVYGAKGKLDNKGNVIANKESDIPAKIPAGFYKTIDDIIDKAKHTEHSTLNKLYPIMAGKGYIIPQDIFDKLISAFDSHDFGHGKPWDVQRLYPIEGHIIDDQLRDISTINIGIYAAASGMSLDDILTIENTYALYKRSTFDWSIDKKDPEYSHLPQRNVENTKIGYDLYKSGQIKGQ